MAAVTPLTSPNRNLSQRFASLLAGLDIAVTLVLFMLAPILALRWSDAIPFPNVLVGQTFIVSDSVGNDWGPTPQFDKLDRIIAIDGQPIATQTDYQQALLAAFQRPNHLAQITFERSIAQNSRVCGEVVRLGIRQCEVNQPVRLFPANDRTRLFGLPYLIGLAYLAIGIWVFRQRATQRASLSLTIICCSLGTALALNFDQASTNALIPMYWISLGLASGAIVAMGLVFPQQPRVLDGRPALRYISYLPGLVLALYTISQLYNLNDPWASSEPIQWLFIFSGLSILFFIGIMIYRRLSAGSPVVKQQSRIILWGSIAAFMPFVIWIVLSILDSTTPFLPIVYLPPLILFPIAIAFSLLRFNLLDVDHVITNGLGFLILSAMLVVLYAGLLALVSQLLHDEGAFADSPIFQAIFILLIAVALDPLRHRIQRLVDRLFFRSRLSTQELLQTYSRRLTEKVSLPEIVSNMQQQIEDALRPEQLLIYLLDIRLQAYIAQPNPQLQKLPPSVTRFTTDSLLSQWLKAGKGPRYLQLGRPLPELLQPDQARLETIGATLYVPLAGRDQINGWLALSHKQSGVPFTTEDITYLSALADQTALALERAIAFDDVQRRINELNVLSRVSQAVNFTLNPDDILELIYAQTSRVLETNNFYIALADHKRGVMRFAFYVEAGERLYPDDEWPIELGLTGEIMRHGQSIVAADYVQESIKRGFKSSGRPGRAWMGVALNAGDRPLGVMSVSDFRPEISYSQEQLQILAAIADQAASVLDKARLYRETEERARQLAVLNEVSSNLTSSLDLRTVLSTIVRKAIEILHAEAGSLLLVDEATNELVFEVTFGPAGPDLRGTRLPFGAGIVGSVAKSRQPQIVNEAKTDARWLRDVDKETAFSTRAILAVPMIVKDRVTGVIELINKLGSETFTEEDQGLLSAFATNAAVAVENARLFTMTDQALASRVDELSMLQEIDRQLNQSLELRTVLDLALEWGLRIADASAGSICMADWEHDVVLMMAHRNYTYTPASLPIDQGLAGQVIRTGQAVLVNNILEDSHYIAASATTRSQLSVPIKRGDAVIGVLNVESNKLNHFGILLLDTVSRLADHAAIAITNANLYQEVRNANEAKSKFVNDVAHELNQPMTSIKGFTDMMIKGLAGAVNEMQVDFLSRIRFNTERMNTLIHDLLEIGRIETGRLKLDIKPNSIKSIVEDTIRSLQSQIDERKMTVELTIPENVPEIMADRARLIQIVTNLVSNAYKYSPNGGQIAIGVSQLDSIQPPDVPHGNWTRTDLKTVKQNPLGYVMCSIKDTGVGISPEDQTKLFTQFFRSGAVRDVPGTGLGLTITKSLVELQQGAIWLETEVDQGSTFSFSMPIAGDGDGTGSPAA
jgi:signal transduction histidine kinase